MEKQRAIGFAAIFAAFAGVGIVVGSCSDSESTPSGGSGGSAGTSAGSSMAGSSTAGASGSGTAGTASGAGGSSSGNGGSSGGSGGGSPGDAAVPDAPASTGDGGVQMNFFVSSDKSMTGNLGGIMGADKRCQDLAAAVGRGSQKWIAYLSTEAPMMSARERMGTGGPWYNQKGIKIADTVAQFHTTVKGDANLFIDEKGNKINGQWTGSPTPNEHDILTGTMADGSVATGKTCTNWTSNAANVVAAVGHSDGLGPGMATTGTYTSWNASHDNQNCSDTAPRGGAGRIYCFTLDK